MSHTTIQLSEGAPPCTMQEKERQRARRFVIAIASLLTALAAAIIFASSVGPVPIPFRRTIAIMLDQLGATLAASFSEREQMVIMQIRLPRVLTGGLVGAALGISGAAMQGLFRNPLVEPGYVGVSSGAAAGAVCALFFGWSMFGPWAVPLSAFTGAVIAVFLILAVWQSSRMKSTATLLLLGIGINALLSALINIMVASSDTEQELRSIIFWLQGGLEARTWEHVRLIALPIVVGALITMMHGRDLNMMLLGDEQAASAGVSVKKHATPCCCSLHS